MKVLAVNLMMRGKLMMSCGRQLHTSLASAPARMTAAVTGHTPHVHAHAQPCRWLMSNRCMTSASSNQQLQGTKIYTSAGPDASVATPVAPPCTASYSTTASSSSSSSSSSIDSSRHGVPVASSYIHLGLQQERINADGSLSTANTWYRQQQQQPVANSSTTIDLANADRSSSSGTTSSGRNSSSDSSQQQQQQQQQQVSRPPGLAAAAPAAAPITQQQLDVLADLIQSSKRVVVITGAGCSTESNIPDYRGPGGAYTTGFTPMTHQQFTSKPENRARYWARSFAGWHEFAHVAANAAHEAIARLQSMGWCDLIITQNVDRLHHKGGASKVLELHGTTHRVICLDCGDNTCRHELQQRLAVLNPAMAQRVRSLMSAAGSSTGISNRSAYDWALRAGTAADARKVTAGKDAEQVPVMRPDGDVELADAGTNFKLPACVSCGSERLKPDVVFFGDSVPKERVNSALSAAQSADLVLVVGSSLMVWSAFRLVKAAKEAGARLAIVNVGPTRADEMADYKVEALAGEVMMQLAMHPSMLLPRVP